MQPRQIFIYIQLHETPVFIDEIWYEKCTERVIDKTLRRGEVILPCIVSCCTTGSIELVGVGKRSET
jgi:hypothetical protein